MDDSATRLSSQFERAGLVVLLAFVLAVSGYIWRSLPDRTSGSFSSLESSTTGADGFGLVLDEKDSIVDRLRRLEGIPHPELTFLLLVGVALSCAIPLITHKPTVSPAGRLTCRLGELLGALFVVAGVVTCVDVLYQDHGFDTLARPLNHLNAAALAAVSVALARVATKPDDAKRLRGRITRVKRPLPQPLGVPRDSRRE